jgi:hypothetical protein
MTCQVTIHWFAIVGAFFVGGFAGMVVAMIYGSFQRLK